MNIYTRDSSKNIIVLDKSNPQYYSIGQPRMDISENISWTGFTSFNTSVQLSRSARNISMKIQSNVSVANLNCSSGSECIGSIIPVEFRPTNDIVSIVPLRYNENHYDTGYVVIVQSDGMIKILKNINQNDIFGITKDIHLSWIL